MAEHDEDSPRPDAVHALELVVDRLTELAKSDGELRAALDMLARRWLARPVAEPAPEAPVSEPPVTEDVPPAPAPEVVPAKRTLVFETPEPVFVASASMVRETAIPAHGYGPSEVTDEDLPVIEIRARLKARGARWAVRRRRLIAGGADFKTEVEPLDREIIEEAKALPACFLWMCHPSAPWPENPDLYEDVGNCFETLSDAVQVVRRVLGEPAHERELPKALELMAEAQSALRQAVEQVGGRPDPDQRLAYAWLKETGLRQQIYIPRFMRSDDQADPGAVADLDERIQQLDADLQSTRNRTKETQAAIKKVRYHLQLIERSGPSEVQRHWDTVVGTIDKMVNSGTPPSNPDIRELLLPVIEDMPELDDLPSGFRLVLRELDRYLDSRAPVQRAEVPDAEAPAVGSVRDWLRGTRVVLIGGVRRPYAHEALKRTFDLDELDWVDSKEHQSIAFFEPHVARDDVALVILAIRWCSHSFGDVKQFCEAYGKPLVRLKAGYNPNQVAVQILDQCSEQMPAR